MNSKNHNGSIDAPRKVMPTIDSVINWQIILLCVLFVLVILVAIKTVVHRHEARNLFMQAHKLEKERDVLAAEWSHLKLEQGTVLNQVSVERKARWDLGMKMPKASEIVMIREPRQERVVVRNAPSVSGKAKVSGKDTEEMVKVSLGE